jgi:hypothetical protein
LITDYLISGEDENRRCRTAPRCEYRRDGDSHRRITTHRFQHDVTVHGGFAHLLGNDKPEVGIRDDDRPIEQRIIVDAIENLLKGRPFVDQRHKLLRHAFTGYRPQASARSTTQNYWN